MATNPRIPQEVPKQPQLVPSRERAGPEPAGSGIRRVVMAVLVAAVLLGAMLYFMPHHPQQASPPSDAKVPGQPVPGELQLQGVQVISGATSGSLYLDGRLTNTGPHEITGIMADVKLRGRRNEVVAEIERPLEGMAVRGSDLAADPFVQNPIRPKQTRSFRISLDQVPDGWNNNLPEVQIVTVTGEATGK
jgi:hypothetical protein